MAMKAGHSDMYGSKALPAGMKKMMVAKGLKGKKGKKKKAKKK